MSGSFSGYRFKAAWLGADFWAQRNFAKRAFCHCLGFMLGIASQDDNSQCWSEHNQCSGGNTLIYSWFEERLEMGQLRGVCLEIASQEGGEVLV